MHKINVKSEPVRRRSSKRLELVDLKDVFFFERMYAGFSDVDAKEGCIKYRAFESTKSEQNSQGLKSEGLIGLEKMSQLKDMSEKSNPSASSSSESGNDCIKDLTGNLSVGDLPEDDLPAGDLPAGDLPVIERPLPYFSLA